MKSLYLLVVLVSLAAWLRCSQGQITCDKKKTACTCESSNANFSKIDVSEALKSSIGKSFPDNGANAGKYVYQVNFCKGLTCAHDPNTKSGGKGAVACQQQIDGIQNISSKLGDVGSPAWQIFPENNTFTVLYDNGDATNDNKPRKTILYINVVNKDHDDVNKLTYLEERKPEDNPGTTAHVYAFTINILPSETNRGTGGGGGNKAGVIGIVLILLVLVAIVAYFVVGGILMYTVKGARGTEVIPQFALWKALPGLIKDGFLFTISPCVKLAGRGKTGYQSL